jgi:hypothetical protein
VKEKTHFQAVNGIYLRQLDQLIKGLGALFEIDKIMARFIYWIIGLQKIKLKIKFRHGQKLV